jgi:4'-phosphopantetheinyl transferase EntD
VDPVVAFDLNLEHGLCVGVHLPDTPDAIATLAETALLPEERAFAQGMAPARRRTWIGGRVAQRCALARAWLEAPAVLPHDRGAPTLPVGMAGSISHKEAFAAALIAREPKARVGVDVELDAPRAYDIARIVLAEDEEVELAPLGPADRAREVLLRFSAKEAIYKALDPFVRRFVSFKEVSVSPRPDGSAAVSERLGAESGQFAIDVRWRRFDGLVLTTARVSRLGDSRVSGVP